MKKFYRDDRGVSLLEMMTALGIMGILSLGVLQLKGIEKSVKTDITEKTINASNEAYLKKVIVNDMGNSSPSFSSGSSMSVWNYKESAKEAKAVSWSLDGQNNKVFEFYRFGRNEYKLESSLFHPHTAYIENSKKQWVYSSKNFIKSLKQRIRLENGKAPVGLYLLKSPATVAGVSYSKIIYFNGDGIVDMSPLRDSFYEYCSGAKNYKNFMDKFLRCFPESGGLAFFQVESVVKVRYTFNHYEDSFGNLVRSKSDDPDVGGEPLYKVKRYVARVLKDKNKLNYGHGVMLSDEITDMKVWRDSAADTQMGIKFKF